MAWTLQLLYNQITTATHAASFHDTSLISEVLARYATRMRMCVYRMRSVVETKREAGSWKLETRNWKREAGSWKLVENWKLDQILA